jgi:hypothetical protein
LKYVLSAPLFTAVVHDTCGTHCCEQTAFHHIGSFPMKRINKLRDQYRPQVLAELRELESRRAKLKASQTPM